VSYREEFEFKNLSRLIAPLLKPALERLWNQAQVGMRGVEPARGGLITWTNHLPRSFER
jgi:hypothetical protein